MGDLIQLAPAQAMARAAFDVGDYERAGRLCAAIASTVDGGESERGAGHGLELVGVGEIFAPLPPPNDLVAGVIRRGTVCLLGAYGGSGKTWVATDLGLAVASGGRWLGAFDCMRGRVTFLDYESGSFELRRRIQAIAAPRGITGRDGLAIDLAAFPSLYAQGADFAPRLEALARERELIVIDSLAAVSAGVDENSADMRRGLDVMRGAAERTGCVFVVVLHAKKVGANGGEIDARELFRGSSAIYDAADTALAITKLGERWKLSQTKARHGRQIEPLEVRLLDERGGVVVRGEPWEDERPATRATKGETLLRDIVSFVRDNPGCSKNEIELAIRGSNADKRAAIGALLERGSLVQLEGDRRSIRFRIGSPN
jgi:hypothetical protein